MFSARSLLIVAALALCGCHGKAYQVSEPVVGPAPPRISADHAFQAHADGCACAQCARGTPPAPTPLTAPGNSTGEIKQVSGSDQIGPDTPLEMTDVVARVNGEPIFLADVIGPQEAAVLKQAKGEAPPAQIRQLQNEWITKSLQNEIDTIAMADAVWVKLKEEQQTSINAQLDEFFIQDIERKMSENNIRSIEEFESALRRMGMSFEGMRRRFGRQQIGMQYMNEKIGKQPPLTPADLRSEYERRAEEFTTPAEVKWQQIQVIVDNHPSPEAARSVLDEALSALRQGQPFDQVAKKYSEGPLADSGGQWDWTQTRSLTDRELAKTLDSIPPNQLSRILDDGRSLSVILVNERKPAHVKPFRDVQRELRQSIEERWRSEQTERVLADIRQTAVVESIVPLEKAGGVATRIEQVSAGQSGTAAVRTAENTAPAAAGLRNFTPGDPAPFPEE